QPRRTTMVRSWLSFGTGWAWAEVGARTVADVPRPTARRKDSRWVIGKLMGQAPRAELRTCPRMISGGTGVSPVRTGGTPVPPLEIIPGRPLRALARPADWGLRLRTSTELFDSATGCLLAEYAKR